MSNDMCPEGLLVKVTMEIRVPKAATDDEIDEWLRFSLGANGSCSGKNPLINSAVEPFGGFGFDWEDTGQTGREERILKEERADGSKLYSVRHHRERVVQ